MVNLITVQVLQQKLAAAEKIVLIDVREAFEHNEFNIGGKLIPCKVFLKTSRLFQKIYP